MRGSVLILALSVVVALPMEAFAQGNPTGSIRGQVYDPDDLPLPGVTLTAVSLALKPSSNLLCLLTWTMTLDAGKK